MRLAECPAAPLGWAAPRQETDVLLALRIPTARGLEPCLHCGRIETSAPVAAPDRPERADERRRRRAPWLVGILLAVGVIGLALGVFWQASARFVPPPQPVEPTRPAEAPTEKVLPPLGAAPSEGWTLPVSDPQPQGVAAPVFLYPGVLQPAHADLAVVVSAAEDRSYVRGLDLTSGAIEWVRPVTGRVACAYDRLESVLCFTSEREALTISLGDWSVTDTHFSRAESPASVWVSASGAIFVLSVSDPGGEGVHEVGVTLVRVNGTDGTLLWTQTATLPMQSGTLAELTGVGPLVAVRTQASGPAGSTTPTMLRTQEAGVRIGGLTDGLDATVLPDGRIGVQHAVNDSTLYDSSGKELFPVKARVTTIPGRDVPSAQVPTIGVVTPPADPDNPEPPTLVAIQPTGAVASIGTGSAQLVCGGLLVTHDGVHNPRVFQTQALAGGSQTWTTRQEGDLVSTACDGSRLVAMTIENGMPVLRGYALSTGDVVWRAQYEERSYVGEVPGRGWLLRNDKENRWVMVRR